MNFPVKNNMTPAETYKKYLEKVREHFRVLFMSDIYLMYIFLGTIAIGVSGCSIQTRFIKGVGVI